MKATALLTLLLALPALAGPITPPPGPVASTHKTLSEIEPRIAINTTNTPGDALSLFKITQPGSYYLTGNITGEAGKDGIRVTTGGVTIDLNGFDLAGVPDSGSAIRVEGAAARVRISNGSVRNWGTVGVLITGGSGQNLLERITASGNGGSGFSVDRTALVDCAANNNQSSGFVLVNSRASGCVASGNGQTGFVSTGSATLYDCQAYQNATQGFNCAGNVLFEDCLAIGNTGSGFVSTGGVSAQGCYAADNGGAGFFVSSVNTGGVIRACTARFNGQSGIQVTNGIVIEGNALFRNGQTSTSAGITITGSDNRVVGNNCVGADRGIEVTVAGNVIIDNTCSDNTINWLIAANNVVGPIIDRTAPASAAISGNSAPSSLGTTDPNANFTY